MLSGKVEFLESVDCKCSESDDSKDVPAPGTPEHHLVLKYQLRRAARWRKNKMPLVSKEMDDSEYVQVFHKNAHEKL